MAFPQGIKALVLLLGAGFLQGCGEDGGVDAPPVSLFGGSCTLSSEGGAHTMTWSGSLTYRTIACFEQFLARSPASGTIEIDSGGGDAIIGIVLGSQIHKHGFRVRVLDRCISSCANYIVTSASALEIGPSARIGVHGRPEFHMDEVGQLRSEFEAAGLTGAELVESVQISIANFEGAAVAHDAFAQRLGIDPRWFEMDAGAPGTAMVALRTVEDFQSCLPSLPVVSLQVEGASSTRSAGSEIQVPAGTRELDVNAGFFDDQKPACG